MSSSSLTNRILVVGAALSLSGQSAFAQGFIDKKSNLPDASRFYMSRMQVQVIDEAPIVNYQTNPPGSPASNQIPGVPRGLPRAGWSSYTPANSNAPSNLPRTNNGVPPRGPAPGTGPTGNKGHTGKMKPPASKAPMPLSSNVPAAYAPYKGFNPAGSAPPAQDPNAKTQVRGILHWARGQR